MFFTVISQMNHNVEHGFKGTDTTLCRLPAPAVAETAK